MQSDFCFGFLIFAKNQHLGSTSQAARLYSFLWHLSCSFLNLLKLINHLYQSKVHTVPMTSYVRYAWCLKYDVLLVSTLPYCTCTVVRERRAEELLPYIAVTDGVHCQQVVAMTELEVDDFQSSFHFSSLFGLSWAALPHDVLEEQTVLADPLHRLEQVRPQVHLVA